MFLRGLHLFGILLSLKCSLIICDVMTVSGVYETQGFRSHMEDTHIQKENIFGIGIYGIFDGHRGTYASSFVAKFIINVTMNEIMLFAYNSDKCVYKDPIDGNLVFVQMLRDFIGQAECHLKTARLYNIPDTGTTCLIAIAEKNRLTVANVGDSRGVMCDSNGIAIPLSFDHKPNRDDEAQRIKNAGGYIHFLKNVPYVNGLGMSRSLGDFDKKSDKNIIIPTPDIREFDLQCSNPKFMILASDGLWDVMNNQCAVDFIKDHYLQLEHFGANALVTRALQLGSKDNITVLIVVFINGQYVVGSATAP